MRQDLEYWIHEATQWRERLDAMEERNRNLMGENILGFEIKDLQNLENQLQTGVSQIRKRKMQLLMDQVQDFQRKECLLLHENEILRSKIAKAFSMQTSSVITDTISHDIQDSSSVKASSRSLRFAQDNESMISVAKTTLQLGRPWM